ncbi:unnamed protein product, partial [Chrysoparadoxa australica]
MYLHFVGLEVGLLLCYLETTFCQLHGVHPELWTFFFQLLMAHACYGMDRPEDVKDGTSTNEELQDYVSLHEMKMRATVDGSILLASTMLASQAPELLCPFLVCVYEYRTLKRSIGGLKPVLIALAFTTSALLLPSKIAEGGYSGVMADFQATGALFFNVLSSSNMLDVSDMEEDMRAGVNTLPVLLG